MNSRIGAVLLPACGVLLVVLIWGAVSTQIPDLPSPARTWSESKIYILQPLEKRGEMDQGIILLAYYSLWRVAKGFFLGILLGTPLGFMLGLSKTFHRMFDPIVQVLRPISPLAWLPLGLVVFQKSEPAALFTIGLCSMWPTVINTMSGVRSIPQEYWNVARVLRLSKLQTVLEGSRSCDLAVHVHGLSLESRHRLARHRGERDVDRGLRASEVFSGRNTTASFTPTSALHSDYRNRRIPARSRDGLRRAETAKEQLIWLTSKFVTSLNRSVPAKYS
jgi:hypothetical protein